MKTVALSILSLALFLSACEDPAANKPKANVANASNTATTNTAANNANAPSESLAVTPEN